MLLQAGATLRAGCSGLNQETAKGKEDGRDLCGSVWKNFSMLGQMDVGLRVNPTCQQMSKRIKRIFICYVILKFNVAE